MLFTFVVCFKCTVDFLDKCVWGNNNFKAKLLIFMLICSGPVFTMESFGPPLSFLFQVLLEAGLDQMPQILIV